MTEGFETRIELPDGFTVGHSSDREGWTGCTVILGPSGTVSAGEVRGGGPATREFELLSPATSTPGAHALLLSGGSAFGIGAANGVVRWLEERGLGFPTPVGAVPLVSAAACFDLPVGDPKAYPGPDDAYAACEAAGTEFERGSVGAGTGCSAGKVSFEHCTKTGLGAATMKVGDAILTAIAVVNPYGEVVGSGGEVIAGNWKDGDWRRTVEVMRETPSRMPLGENTTLVCLVTDARLTKNEAWVTARSAAPGFARALSPASTAVDGDLAVCMTSGQVEVDPFLFSILASEVTAEAIRDGARQATDGAGIPAASSRPG
ncbi:MAG: P1 family peptidase [Actinomycetota bacterium]|nr:P1 family peptidase [Actinomycetota bacterium]